MNDDVFDMFADADSGWPHDSESDALAALSAACVRRRRQLAGLPSDANRRAK